MSWKVACAIDDVPENTLKKCDVDGIAIIIANYGDGFRAFPPLCPHMEEPLEESGLIADCIMTCSKHLWQWDLRTLALIEPAEKPLQTYDCKVEDGKVLAFVDKELVYEFEDEDDMDDDDFFDN